MEHCVKTHYHTSKFVTYHKESGRHGEWKQNGTEVLKERLEMPVGYVAGKEENYKEEGLRATDKL